MLESLRFQFWRARDAFRDRLRGSTHREEIFASIHRQNLWGDSQSVSGPGSGEAATVMIRSSLPPLLRELQVRSLLDAPCGDFGWMQHVAGSLDSYVGADIVAGLIADNQKRYGSGAIRFVRLDVVTDPLPGADAILCRDFLIHLPTRLIRMTLANFMASGARWLLMSNHTGAEYLDIPLGSVRPIDFMAPPFLFPQPHRMVDDGGSAGRKLCVWELAALRASLGSSTTG